MSYLDDLLASTRRRVEDAKQKVTQGALEQRIAAVEPPRGFVEALSGPDISIIAEIKRATPRAGELDRGLNASETARAYAAGGASALSVLTEPEYFWGTLEDLAAARGPGLPVLRKDFVLEDFQVFESRAAGADAVLLIVRILDDGLDRLIAAARALGMDALVEVHDERDLDRALDAGASLIGVNHRDLETFDVDPERTAKLAPSVPEACTVIALSGVGSRAEMEELAAAGASAVLVGESLVTASDPAAKLRELLGKA
ncbi:MAG: indole-3-glycerol phosphate synthase TrpC [Actinomycetota bacterium]